MRDITWLLEAILGESGGACPTGRRADECRTQSVLFSYSVPLILGRWNCGERTVIHDDLMVNLVLMSQSVQESRGRAWGKACSETPAPGAARSEFKGLN